MLEESKKPEKKLISYANETLLLIIQEIRRFERAYISCSFDNVITSGCTVFFFCVNYRQKKKNTLMTEIVSLIYSKSITSRAKREFLNR